MIDDADGTLEEWKEDHPELHQEYIKSIKLEDDLRVTPVGKIQRNTGLDELPHFFNVVREQMSLVGPRPIVEEQKKEYGRKYLEKRGSVKPGITGY